VTSVREDLGFVEKPAAFKPRPPAARIERVRFDGTEWEATVIRANGKRVWRFANSERDVRAKALATVREGT
jgi:hypothetical protein